MDAVMNGGGGGGGVIDMDHLDDIYQSNWRAQREWYRSTTKRLVVHGALRTSLADLDRTPRFVGPDTPERFAECPDDDELPWAYTSGSAREPIELKELIAQRITVTVTRNTLPVPIALRACDGFAAGAGDALFVNPPGKYAAVFSAGASNCSRDILRQRNENEIIGVRPYLQRGVLSENAPIPSTILYQGTAQTLISSPFGAFLADTFPDALQCVATEMSDARFYSLDLQTAAVAAKQYRAEFKKILPMFSAHRAYWALVCPLNPTGSWVDAYLAGCSDDITEDLRRVAIHSKRELEWTVEYEFRAPF